MIILDTCAILWLTFNREKITSKTLSAIEKEDEVAVSVMSFWEIGLKVRKNKLHIPISARHLVELFNGFGTVTIMPLQLDIIMDSLELVWSHPDPVDRILVAIARKNNAVIVSGDDQIKRFYKQVISSCSKLT